jgi:metal-sulfur cluster biosynthetic enzyme
MNEVESREPQIRQALEKVVDPCSIATGVPINLVAMGMVKEVCWEGGNVRVVLRLTSPICWQAVNILRQVELQVSRLDGVRAVTCMLDPLAEWTPQMMDGASRERLRALRPLPPRRW